MRLTAALKKRKKHAEKKLSPFNVKRPETNGLYRHRVFSRISPLFSDHGGVRQKGGAQSALIPLGPRLIRKSSHNDVLSWHLAQDPSSLAAACAWSVVWIFFVEAVLVLCTMKSREGPGADRAIEMITD
jgi:hypothetical protein